MLPTCGLFARALLAAERANCAEVPVPLCSGQADLCELPVQSRRGKRVSKLHRPATLTCPGTAPAAIVMVMMGVSTASAA